MGRGLGAILSSESKVSIHTAADEGADKLVGQYYGSGARKIFSRILRSQELILMKKRSKIWRSPLKIWA